MTMKTSLLSMLAAGLLAFPSLADEQIPTLSVQGSGEVTAAPDMAKFTVAVTNEGASAKDAMAENSANMGAVLAQLRMAGIADSDIQTSGISVSPRWDHGHREDGRPPRILGYVATNTLNVTVEEIANLGTVLDAVVKDGANSLGGISFGLKDPRPALAEARKLSVSDALEQAELYAEAAGVRLVRIISIQPMTHRAPKMAELASFSARAMDSVPVAEGEIATSADVSVTWEIAPATEPAAAPAATRAETATAE